MKRSTAIKQTNRILHEMNFIQNHTPPFHAEQWRVVVDDSQFSAQGRLFGNIVIVIGFEVFVGEENNIELSKILWVKKQMHIIVYANNL